MARSIAPTPKLDAKNSRKFLRTIEEDLRKPMGPVPTPKIDQAIKKIMSDAERKAK